MLDLIQEFRSILSALEGEGVEFATGDLLSLDLLVVTSALEAACAAPPSRPAGRPRYRAPARGG